MQSTSEILIETLKIIKVENLGFLFQIPWCNRNIVIRSSADKYPAPDIQGQLNVLEYFPNDLFLFDRLAVRIPFATFAVPIVSSSRQRLKFIFPNEASSAADQLKRIFKIKLKIFTYFFRALYTQPETVLSFVFIWIFSEELSLKLRAGERAEIFVYLLTTRVYFTLCIFLYLIYFRATFS